MGALDSWLYEASVQLVVFWFRCKGGKGKTEKQGHPLLSQSPRLSLRSVSSVLVLLGSRFPKTGASDRSMQKAEGPSLPIGAVSISWTTNRWLWAW